MKRGGHLEICLEKEGTLDFEKGVTPFSLTIRVHPPKVENMKSTSNFGPDSRSRDLVPFLGTKSIRAIRIWYIR